MHDKDPSKCPSVSQTSRKTAVKGEDSGASNDIAGDRLGSSRVVDFAHIDQLLAPGPSDVFRVALAHQSLVGGFDCVHGIP